MKAAILGCAGTALSADERAFFRDADPLGFILFARNIDSPEQTRRLTEDLRSCVARAEAPVLIDQEGGRVARLKAPFTEWPPMATLGRSGDVALAERFARALATELRAVGITLDYAPVLDIHTNPNEVRITDV